jgi:hypothetical protein
MSLRYPTSDSELQTAVRDETSYDNTEDELPQTQLDTIIERAKGRMELETGSSAWYSDDGLGYALVAYTCMRAKAAVENVPLSSYSLGDEQVSFDTSDATDSQQMEQWAEDVRVGLDASDKDEQTGPRLADSAGYVGENYINPDRRH